MREFKFRAFEYNQMYYQVRVGGMFYNEPTAPTYWDAERKEWIHLTGGEYTKVMQYTGLKDKNGKEIYEGDILQDEYGKIDKVIYYKYMFDLEDFYDTGYDIANEAFSEGSDKFEVIGNIYENLKLLK